MYEQAGISDNVASLFELHGVESLAYMLISTQK